jgi:hypothetical protein
MELQRAIRDGNIHALRALEHEILEHANHVYEDYESEKHTCENFSIYWIAIHENKVQALEMMMMFLNTCQTALGNYYHEYMDVMARPALIGAVCSGNQAIVDIMKTYVDEDTFNDVVSTFQ